MFSEAKVTEIFCMADDFCKEFAKTQEKYMVEDKNHKHHPVPLGRLQMFQALLQRVCMQASDASLSQTCVL